MSLPPELILKQMELGPMQNFVYFIGDAATKEIVVVDPGWDIDFLRKEEKKNGFQITSILLTHGHPDHVEGVEELQKTHDVPVIISQHEAEYYVPECKNLKKVAPGEVVKIGNIDIECIHTPGHTAGCQCFRYKDVLLTGDTLFVDGCGRCDLPGGNTRTMYDTLYRVILKLPDSIVIYPGHQYGPTSFATLASQKKTNPYLTCHDTKGFVHYRMGLS
jgi:hydroxyacylglutathione hydrolase